MESDQILSAPAFIAGEKPVSDAWCAHTFRERFGEWPNGLSDYPMDITPTVSNFIRHKLIKYARGQEKAKSLHEAPSAAAPSSVQHAQKAISDIKQQLGTRA